MKVMFPIWRKDRSDCKKWTCPFHLAIQWGFEQLPEHCGVSLLPLLPEPSLLFGTWWKKSADQKKKKNVSRKGSRKNMNWFLGRIYTLVQQWKICNLENNNFWLSALHLLSDVIRHYMYMYCVLWSLELTLIFIEK